MNGNYGFNPYAVGNDPWQDLVGHEPDEYEQPLPSVEEVLAEAHKLDDRIRRHDLWLSAQKLRPDQVAFVNKHWRPFQARWNHLMQHVYRYESGARGFNVVPETLSGWFALRLWQDEYDTLMRWWGERELRPQATRAGGGGLLWHSLVGNDLLDKVKEKSAAVHALKSHMGDFYQMLTRQILHATPEHPYGLASDMTIRPDWLLWWQVRAAPFFQDWARSQDSRFLGPDWPRWLGYWNELLAGMLKEANALGLFSQ